MGVNDPHFHEVELVPPSHASSGLKQLTALVEAWLQDSVDLLGRDDPKKPPDLIGQLVDGKLATESAGQAQMASDYGDKKAQLTALTTKLTTQDDGVRTKTYEAGQIANDTWTTIKGRIDDLKGVLTDPKNNEAVQDPDTHAWYLPAATEARVRTALLTCVTDVSHDLDTAWNKFQAYAQAVADANPESHGGSAPPPSDASGEPTGGPVTAEEISGGQKVTAKAIYDYLIEHYHLTPAQAAGIVGNMQTESSFNTGAWNSAEGALGLCQWEGGRLSALKAYAKAQGKPITDWQTQVDFMMSEMHGGESQAWSALQSAGTPAAAAAAFDQYYERSAGTSRNQRMANATNLASQFATVAA
ncbi:phage tail tip lysozyme [Nocardia sp. BMG111209]|uniref:phage tail tip lysozyme n=1 Tax=Nocardia sp. BMG111209 TaxID=1160137 RepID=UPI000367DD62|nr:phage tail tip lysozyme [Nocardia sp. BMG111209]